MNAPTEMKTPFEMLSKVNVNDHVEKKNGLSYLSWAWAWAELMKADHTATVQYHSPIEFGNKTFMVSCTVTAFGIPRTMSLPVMDHRNKAISDPDAFAFNTAMQRCMVKAIALHGLGLYIYAGEDLPEVEESAQGKNKHSPVTAALQGVELDVEQQAYLRELAAELVDLVEVQGKSLEAFQKVEKAMLDQDDKLFLWDALKPNSKTRSAIKKEGEAHKTALKTLSNEKVAA